jgi:hypothetical protein
MSTAPKSWRDVIKIHPAAELFPLMSPEELRALGEDIKAHGLRNPIVISTGGCSRFAADRHANSCLLDGRNRLDAMELVGIPFELAWTKERYRREKCWCLIDNDQDDEWMGFGIIEPIREQWIDDEKNAYDFVLSANVHRRHLTNGQKRELIAKVLKAIPNLSDRQIATKTGTDHKTVANVRTQAEGRGEIPHVERREDSKGRRQPAEKSKPAKPEASPSGWDAVMATEPEEQGLPPEPMGKAVNQPARVHDMSMILRLLRERTEGASKASRVDVARQVLRTLRLSENDLIRET